MNRNYRRRVKPTRAERAASHERSVRIFGGERSNYSMRPRAGWRSGPGASLRRHNGGELPAWITKPMTVQFADTSERGHHIGWIAEAHESILTSYGFRADLAGLRDSGFHVWTERTTAGRRICVEVRMR